MDTNAIYHAMEPTHAYEVRPRKECRGVNLTSDALPFGRLWYGEPNAVSNAVDYTKFRSRSHDAVIRVYDAAGNVVETDDHAGDFTDANCRFFLQLPVSFTGFRYLAAIEDFVSHY